MTVSSLFKAGLVCGAVALCGCASRQSQPVVAKPTPEAPMTGIVVVKPMPTYKPRPTPTPEVRAVEFSDDRKWLAVGTLQPTDPISGTVAVRDCASNRVVKTWRVPGGVRYMAISPDGKNIAVTSADSKLRVWNWRTGKLLHQATLNGGYDDDRGAPLDYSPDGRSIAFGVQDVRLLNTRSWKISPMGKPRKEVMPFINADLRFSPDGRWLVTSDGFENYQGYTILSLTGGKTRHIEQGDNYGSIVFSHDNRLLAGSLSDDSGSFIFTFDLRNSKIKRRFKRGVYPQPSFIPQDFSPNSKFLVGVRGEDENVTIEIWNIAIGKRAQRFRQTARAVVWLDAKTLLAGDENGVRKLRVKLN